MVSLDRYIISIDGKSIIDINATHEYENMRLSELPEHTRAYIKVQDGFLWMPGEHIVKITGSDLGQIKEIAKTVKFK